MNIEITLSLPGTLKTQVVPFARAYHITVHRDDGIACSEVEALTAISALESSRKSRVNEKKSSAALKRFEETKA